MSSEVIGAGRLTRKQKKELGILPFQVLANAKEAGITKEMSAKEKAFAYAVYCCDTEEFADAWNQMQAGTYGVDWNELIIFLEKLFELLAKFLPLFISFF